MRFLLGLLLATLCAWACAQDLEREARLAKETLDGLVAGDAVWLEQQNGHRFLGLYVRAAQERGAVVIAHGRGWSPDYDLYGQLRTLLADAGFSTLAIQMPVLPGTAKIGDYLPTFVDADERLALAVAWLRAKGAGRVAIVSHSLGSTMANHYLIYTKAPDVDAWVMISIINGLEDMFRIKVPVLDVFAANDWSVTRYGGDERLAQIRKIAGSKQIVVPETEHFFEGRREELARDIAGFLDAVFSRKP
jgi:pimeloyl-ACP methyl ester carboxylesterase